MEIGVDSLGLSIYSDCTCKAKKSATRKLKSSGLRGNQLNYKLEDYKTNDSNRNMFEGVGRYLKAWPELINSDSESKGFCLIGNPGIGKTMLSCIIASDMLAKGVQVVFVSSADLLAELRQAQFSKDREGIEEKIDTLGKAQALIIDDIGKEKPTEWVQAMYYRLIDLRYRNNLLTGFNSNYYPKELAQRLGDFGDATMSRILGLTREHFLCSTDFDHRIEG
ncbi:MAG: ATP-binding protein [Desulfitobacterium hafniense]|nr:ATP-binding protein [Desulfitobacterium hafniense]